MSFVRFWFETMSCVSLIREFLNSLLLNFDCILFVLEWGFNQCVDCFAYCYYVGIWLCSISNIYLKCQSLNISYGKFKSIYYMNISIISLFNVYEGCENIDSEYICEYFREGYSLRIIFFAVEKEYFIILGVLDHFLNLVKPFRIYFFER